jgi:hypothetical protein
MMASAQGLQITVINNGANSANVFCEVGATMNGTLNGSAAVAVGAVLIVFCAVPGAWVTK